MSIPKEPRQIMINLMYLVLTALLALNVSNEILHAFKVINESITSSNTAIVDKNDKVYKAFEELENQAGQRERVKPFNDKAKQIKADVQKTIKLLDDWKEKVVTQSGGRDEKGEIDKEDDINASTDLLVEAKGGDEIKKALIDIRAKLLAAVGDPAAKAALDKNLPVRIVEPKPTEDNRTASWSYAYFHNMPTVAAVTLLAKFQNDIRNSEAAVLTQLSKEAGDVQVKFDNFKAIAVPRNSYVLAGQKVEADIMLAAYNNAINPTVSSNTGRVTKVEAGVASWETSAAGAGLQTVKGTVSIDLGGRMETKPYEFQYMVGTTGASVQLDKMNVFYIGVENPVTVSAAGYSLQDVNLTLAGPPAEGSNVKPVSLGKYGVTVTKPGKVMANITAKKAGGGFEAVGGMEIRVKFIPDPIAKVANKSGGSLATATFKAQAGIVAALENFDFETRFKVTGYVFSVVPKRGDIIGPYPKKDAYFKGSKDIETAIERLKAGDKVFLDEIKAVGPDGRTRNLPPVVFSLM